MNVFGIAKSFVVVVDIVVIFIIIIFSLKLFISSKMTLIPLIALSKKKKKKNLVNI